MPQKYSRKTYVEGGYYHIFNRGVDKRKIFMDENDYSVFLRYLKEYLLPPDDKKRKDLLSNTPRRRPINCHKDIRLLAYCLMPNHFHLFVQQKTKEGLKPFMKALMTNYVMYFNHRYERQGSLFQGIYKAVRIKTDPHFLHISRYIHRNPLEILTKEQILVDYPYSSYKYYIKEMSPKWLDIHTILKTFRKSESTLSDQHHNYHHTYQYFVEKYKPTYKVPEDIIIE
ncbi:transposase [Candidatus Woesebacteria bacterium]|nr:transposase [Candidatus Woesebacteria bacterium]